MSARAVAVSSLSVLLLMAACKRAPLADQPVRQRGVAPSAAVPAAVEPTPAVAPTPSGPEQPELLALTSTEQPQGTIAADAAAPDQAEKPRRNLQNELETMMGSPADCLAARPADQAPARVNISLSANVMPSGAVGRGEVSAPDLSPEEISCVRTRLEALHFAPPIENAPFTVNGALTLNRGS
jgi:hypothetical protein